MTQKIRVKPTARKAKTADVSGFIKVHPHHKRVKATRRTKVKSAGVKGYLRKK